MSDYEQVSGTTVDVGLDNFEYEQRTGTTVNIELSLTAFTISALVNSESVEIQEIFAQVDGEVREVTEAFALINGSVEQI